MLRISEEEQGDSQIADLTLDSHLAIKRRNSSPIFWGTTRTASNTTFLDIAVFKFFPAITKTGVPGEKRRKCDKDLYLPPGRFKEVFNI